MENQEIRTIQSEDSEVRANAASRNIEGYGIVFNRESRDLGGFTEVILPEAINGIFEQSDVLALLNHDLNRGVLARSTNGKGTLKLTPDAKGVKYSFEAPDTVAGNEVIEGIKRGDIRASSFAFSLAQGGEKWEKRADGSRLRTITRFSAIYDVSAVYREAYQDTTVALRNLDKFEESKIEEVKPVIEEPITEPITEAKSEAKPTIDVIEWYRNKQIKY